MHGAENCRFFPGSNRSGLFRGFHTFLMRIVPLLAVTIGFSQELIVNGSFDDGISGWDSLLIVNPAQATQTVSDGICHISIAGAGVEPWNIQLKQKGIPLDSGQVYLFSFEAYAAAARSIDASVGMESGPYSLYTPANQTTFSLGTEKKSFQIYFRMTHPRDSNARVQFNCGMAAIDVFISKVSIQKVIGPMIRLTAPVGGEAWGSNTKQEISWIGAGTDNVSLSFSTDAGLTWESIAEGEENNGTFQWTVPVVSSPWCLVRVLDAAGNGVGDTSAVPFEIGTYFNIVRNGTFNDTSLSGWDKLGVYGSAVASSSITDGSLVIAIDTPGTETWNVQLTQKGIPLVQGEPYVFSFTAWASEVRSCYTNIGQAGGAYQSYLDDTAKGLLTLSTEPKTYRIEFTMSKPSDTAARIEFNVGLTAGTVRIDNVTLVRRHDQGVRRGGTARYPVTTQQIPWIVRSGPRYVVYSLPLKGPLQNARIFDLRGKMVKELDISRERMEWDCRSNTGVPVGPGTYVVKVVSGSQSAAAAISLPLR
jgi:hypothetical protein